MVRIRWDKLPLQPFQRPPAQEIIEAVLLLLFLEYAEKIGRIKSGQDIMRISGRGFPISG
jgi:hypothetical protein